jgi:hypothetical protein
MDPAFPLSSSKLDQLALALIQVKTGLAIYLLLFSPFIPFALYHLRATEQTD